MRITMYLAVATAVVALAACSAPADQNAKPSAADSSAASTPSSTPTTPSPPSSPAAPPPLPKAKDGTNLRACQDGTCEVLVTKPVDVSFDGRHGVGSMHIEVSADGVDFTGVTGGGMVMQALQQRPDQGGSTSPGGASGTHE